MKNKKDEMMIITILCRMKKKSNNGKKFSSIWKTYLWQNSLYVDSNLMTKSVCLRMEKKSHAGCFHL